MDCNLVSLTIQNFIRSYVKESTFSGVIIGLSGGIDSTLVAYLSTYSLGKENVFGVLLPFDDQSYIDGMEVAKLLGIRYEICNLGSANDIFDVYNDIFITPLQQGNFVARMRMGFLYAIAAREHKLVLGTTNKTEYELGYFTKWGDGAVDLEPIMDLYKTEVWELAKYLHIPDNYIKKPPSAELWNGQTDEEELGIEYRMADSILKNRFIKVDPKYIEHIDNIKEKAEHKKKSIPFCVLENK